MRALCVTLFLAAGLTGYTARALTGIDCTDSRTKVIDLVSTNHLISINAEATPAPPAGAPRRKWNLKGLYPLLMARGYAMLSTVDNLSHPNEVAVLVGTRVAILRCHATPVLPIASPGANVCYEQTPVRLPSGERRFWGNFTGLLQMHGRRVACGEAALQNKMTITKKAAAALDDALTSAMATKALANGLFRGDFQEDVTRLFNPEAILKLIDMEETESDHVFGRIAAKIRSIWPKMTVGYLSFYVVLAVTIVSLALSRGIPPLKCFALVFSICKIFVDYDKYLKETRLKSNMMAGCGEIGGQKNGNTDVEEVVKNNLVSLNAILARLEEVELRLDQLEPHSGKLHQFELENALAVPRDALALPRHFGF